jgi:hypothetical protein
MSKYINKTSRLSVKFFNADTNEQLFEISNRNWMDVGEMFAAHNVSELINQTIEEQNLPDTVIVLTSGEYIKQ